MGAEFINAAPRFAKALIILGKEGRAELDHRTVLGLCELLPDLENFITQAADCKVTDNKATYEAPGLKRRVTLRERKA